MPVHHLLEQILNEYIEAAGLQSGQPLFQSVNSAGMEVTGRALNRYNASRTIAKILKEKYGLEVSRNSIWSFVRARTLGRGRKIKYKIAPDLVQPPATPAPSHGGSAPAVGGPEQETDQELSAVEAARARAKKRTQKQETKKWNLGYDPSKPLKDQT